MFKTLTLMLVFCLPACAGPAKKTAPAQPAAFKAFAMEDKLFSCDVPADWKQERDLEREKRNKTPKLELVGPRAEKSPVLIYAAFYAKDGKYFDGFQDFIDRNSKDSWGETEDKYGPVKETALGGRKAFAFDREVKTSINPESPSGGTVQIYEKFYVIPAADGFFSLHFYAPKSVSGKHLPVFERLAKTFKGKN
ncbi:MAG: hypothetical protein A2X31_10210 [Elusimicrobia bacterium GWB2_63_22]|nr:MAG: hypothetical protein A2X31_10210 [Elusimicrobia bacterium GWB2_63_22]